MDDVDRILSALYGHVRSNDEMADSLVHTIRRKREKREAQVYRLLQYKGPDVETKRVLQQSFAEWSTQPQRFWERVGRCSDAFSDPQVEIVLSFLQAIGDDA